MKVSIIGAGNVGSTCANYLACSGKVNHIILIDKTEGHAEGKCMDINQSLSILKNNNTKVEGCTSNYKIIKNSDIIVIAAGARRTAEMTRNDLLKINSKIIESTLSECLKYSPQSIFIIATNPLDNMVYKALSFSKISRNKIIGMAGVLDNARYITLISEKLNINPSNINSLVIGSHNDNMLILPRFTTIEGIPLSYFMKQKDIDDIIKQVKTIGKKIINLSGRSAYYAPGVAIAKIVESINYNKKTIITASVMLNGEYGFKDCCIGVPILLDKNGLNKIVELDLNSEEKQSFKKCIEAIKEQNIHLK
ncbi:MAG: malate dehydrogenase [Bacteroidetes bacterium]|nr:malate dehydrogenase [Bacteroidota bacterium]